MLALSVLLPLSASAADGASAQVSFRPNVEVRAAVLRLGELAQIQCSDPKLGELLRGVELGVSPLVGASRPFTVAYTRVRLRAMGVRDEQITLLGPETVTVTRAAQSVPGDALAKIACAAVEPLAAGALVRVGTPPRDLTLGQGELLLKAREPHFYPGASSSSVGVEIYVDQHLETTIFVDVRLLRRTQVVVAARNLPAGTILTQSDLRVAEVPQEPGVVPMADPGLAVGRQLSVALDEGRPVPSMQLRAVSIVKYGARVKVICRSGSVAVVCTGEALQDGVMGQIIRVRNTASLQDFTARVVGSNQLEMVF